MVDQRILNDKSLIKICEAQENLDILENPGRGPF